MSSDPNADATLLTEHFTYRPAALIDDIINSINVLAYRACDAVEKGLLAADPSNLGFKIPPQTTPEAVEAARAISETAKHEIENGVHQLETLLGAKIDRNFDRFEIFALRHHFSVPKEVKDWIRLAHYEGLDPVLDKDAPSTESITMLRRKLRETQKLHALLRAESARNEATIASLKALLLSPAAGQQAIAQQPYPALAFLQNKGDLTGDVSHPVTTTTSFALSQLPALKSLLTDLQPRLENLANRQGEGGTVGEDDRSWRRERLEFVEKETRRHLERVRGLELGEMGEVRDGEWQSVGRRLGKGEVEDLERVVGMIGGGGEDQAMGQD